MYDNNVKYCQSYCVMEDVVMKYLTDDLKQEYFRITKRLPDIEGFDAPYINVSDVLRAYFVLVDYFTDKSSGKDIEGVYVGIKDENLLASAVGRQRVEFGGHIKYTSPFEICSALFISLTKNHPFVDCNKRTALLVLLYELDRFGYMPISKKSEFENMVVSLAANNLKLTYRRIANKYKHDEDWQLKIIAYNLKKMTAKKNSSYHVSITMRDFCHRLEELGVIYEQQNTKIKFTRIIPAKWIWGKKELNYTAPFHGWTRTVGPGTARDILDGIGMYNEFPNYESLFSDVDPLYKLIEEFEIPLRRLKDK